MYIFPPREKSRVTSTLCAIQQRLYDRVWVGIRDSSPLSYRYIYKWRRDFTTGIKITLGFNLATAAHTRCTGIITPPRRKAPSLFHYVAYTWRRPQWLQYRDVSYCSYTDGQCFFFISFFLWMISNLRKFFFLLISSFTATIGIYIENDTERTLSLIKLE